LKQYIFSIKSHNITVTVNTYKQLEYLVLSCKKRMFILYKYGLV